MIPYTFNLIYIFYFLSILCVKRNDGSGIDFSTTSEELSKFTSSLSRNLRATDNGKNICLDATSKF